MTSRIPMTPAVPWGGRPRWLLAAVVAVVGLATACGDDGSPAVAPTTAAAPTSPSSTSPTTAAGATTEVPPSTSPSSSAPTSVTSATTTALRRDAAALGFGEVAFTIAPAGGGPAASFCALLAETAEQLAWGLMGRRDLAGYDAMLFRFAADTTSEFYMRNVPVPLSIAWFAADGRFVSSTDMAPCADREGCPTYGAAGPYRFALEVLQGGLGRLGVGEGTVLTVGGPCPR